MKCKGVILLLILSLSVSTRVFSQGEIDDEKKIFFRNEKSWAFFIKNNGIGGNFRKGVRVNAFRKRIWEIDMHYVKHAKEIKISNTVTNLNQYVFGKVNFAWDTRAGIGFQHQLFRKFDKTGVEIRYFYTGGATLLLLKPIYYEVFLGNNTTEDQQFNLDSTQYILGRSSFFKGISETTANPGVFAKAGLSFEYSKYDTRLQALELGAMASVYLNEFQIMWDHKTRYLFSIFISFRWGKIIRGGRMEGVELEGDTEF
jgi:hypothetical protein